MATKEKDLSATLQGGSDVIFDFYCEPCNTEGHHLEAVGFCTICHVYMCTGCVRDHKRNPASRCHQVLDAGAMPRSPIKPKIKDVLTQPCQKHEDKILEYYCSKDDALCCHVCLNLDHASCKRAYIRNVSSETAASQEYQDVETGLDRLTVLATDEEINIDLNEKNNDAYHSTAIFDIKSSRKEMDKLLDDAEDRAIKRVNELHSRNAEKIRSASQSCQSVLSDAKTMAAELGERARAGKNNQLFVGVKMAARRLPAMENINQIHAQKISRFMFDNDKRVKEFKSILSALFPVTVRQDDAATTARHVGEINVKAEEDNKDCGINGMAALSGDRLVVTDCNNNAVKLIGVKQNIVTSRLALSSTPFDVISTKPDQVAVTLGNEKKIEIFTATNILTRTQTINVPGPGFTSVCYDRDIFIVLYDIKRVVKIVDMTGSVVSTVYTDSESDRLFKNPRYITLGRALDVVYITDREANTVTCMTLRGRVIWVYKHDELKLPLGVVVGRDGDVMVCSTDTHTVQLVSCSGQLVQVLMKKKRGLAPGPRALCVSDDKLWVSSASTKPEHCNYIRMFQLQ